MATPEELWAKLAAVGEDAVRLCFAQGVYTLRRSLARAAASPKGRT